MSYDAPVQLREATCYTILKTGPAYCIGIKMEEDNPAPGFVRFDKNSKIRLDRPTTKEHAFLELVLGDSLQVGSVGRLPDGSPIPLTTGPPTWTPPACPRPEAIVYSAGMHEPAKRRRNLAFVAYTKNASKSYASQFVRIYNPMTLTETCMPVKPGTRVGEGDPVLVDFVVLPPGAYQPPRGDYTIPHDAPCQKAGLLPQRDETYIIVDSKALTPEEMRRYENAYDPALNLSEEERAAAVEEVILGGGAVMQCMVNAEQDLARKALSPVLESEDMDEVVLKADYYPSGTTRKDKNTDMVRAARIFKAGQQLQIAPEAAQGEPKFAFVLAPIRHSKVKDDRITFTFAIPEYVADKIWQDQWQSILGRSFLFKPSANQILQRHFHRKLRDGELRKILTSGHRKPVELVIRALFGDVSAISKSDISIQRPHKTPAGNVLSTEQTRGLAFSLRELLSIIQAAAGSGKTTTTSAITMEQTKLRNSCTAMLASMNIAIDNSSAQLAKLLKKSSRRAIVFQAATYLSSRTAEDDYHKYRLPQLLVKLGEGEFGPLTDEEAALVKSANFIASKRYRGLRGMDWSSVLHGEVKMEDRADFVAAIKILLEKYKPEIVLGTTSTLLSSADYLAPYVTDIVIDEAGTAAVLDVTCLLMSWTNAKTLTMVGDINQLPNFTAPMPNDKRKYGFESALRKAAMHPNVASTQLSEVYRSHPLIVRVLSAYAYARSETPSELRTTVKARDRNLMTHSGLPCGHSPILVVNCRGKHKETAALSYSNEQQARLALAIAQKLATRLPAARVRYLATYSGAREQLNEGLYDEGLDLLAGTVDGSQGQECDITVLETAYQPDDKHKSKFMDTRERLTVAISRARDGLVIIGDVEALKRLEEWRVLFGFIEQFCPNAFVQADDIRRDASTPGTELALSLQSLGLPSHPSPRPSSSGNAQQPTPTVPPAVRQSAILKQIVASRGHNYDMSDFEEMYAEVKRSRGEAQLDDAAASQASSAKRKPDPAQQNLAAIAALVPGIILPQPTINAAVEAVEGQQDEPMEHEDVGSNGEEHEEIQPGWIQMLVDAESDEDTPQTTRTVIIDEGSDSSDAENDDNAPQALVQQMTVELVQDLAEDADISRRISALQGPSSGNPRPLVNDEMDTDTVEEERQGPEPSSPPSSADTIEQLSPLTRDGRADAARQALEEAKRFLPLETEKQDAMWRAKNAPSTLPPIPKKKSDASQHKPDLTLSLPQEDEPEQLVSQVGRRADETRSRHLRNQMRCLPAHTMKKEPEYKTPAQLLRIPKSEPVDTDRSKDETTANVATPMEVDGIPADQPTLTRSTGQKASEKTAQIAAQHVANANDKKAKPQDSAEKVTKEKPTPTTDATDAVPKPAKQRTTSFKKASAEDRESRPKKTGLKPTTKPPNGPKKNQARNQKAQSQSASALPQCMEDMFGSDSGQLPAPKKTGTLKKEDAVKPNEKPKGPAQPKGTKPKLAAAQKKLDSKEDASASNKPSAGIKAPGVHKKAEKKNVTTKAEEPDADDLTSASSDDEDEFRHPPRRSHWLMLKLRNPEEYAREKDYARRYDEHHAAMKAAATQQDSEPSKKPTLDATDQPARATPAPATSRRSVSRERSSGPTKTLLGPINPPMPPNIGEKKKTKPSAGAFRLPRDRSSQP